MRIIAGAWRGRRLASVGAGDARAHLRPTADRVRESLFNVLTSGRFGDPISDARVLDVFAGTGALGLEALSRGAKEAVFVENGRKAQAILRENLKLLDVEAEVIARDARRPGPCPGAPFDLVFLDPPYGKGLGEASLAALKDWIKPGALIVWEENAPLHVPVWLDALDSRQYGDTAITICRAGLVPPPPY